MTFPFGEPITIVTRTKSGTDSYGDDTFTETTAVVDGAFAPGGSFELVAGGDVVTTQPTVYLPASVSPRAVDAVLVGGVRYQVDGEPQVWPPHPMTGWRPSLPVVVSLRKVTG